MDDNATARGIARTQAFFDGRWFAIGDISFVGKIPNGDLYQCSWCEMVVNLTEERCPQCKLPFVGPTGFPQMAEWPKANRVFLMPDVFFSENHGRPEAIRTPLERPGGIESE